MVNSSLLIETLTASLSLDALKLSSVSSTSLAEIAIVKDSSSSISCTTISVNIGASFTGVTIIFTSSEAIALP